MVAEKTNPLNEHFKQFSENMRTVADAGLRARESMLRATCDALNKPAVWGEVTHSGSRFAKTAGPFASKNLTALEDCFDASFRSGLNVFATACDSTANSGDGDWQSQTRRLWDAMFEATRTNVEAASKAARATVENWSSFCRSTCETAPVSKPVSKPAK